VEEIRPKPSLSRPAYDLAVLACLLGLIYGVVFLAREWSAPLQPTSEIHLEARYLPLYTWFSLSRGLIAYGFSFLFTLIVGYAAARNRTAERILLPMLDIGQSIPVLGFLPGLVLGLVALFPHRNIGLELASVLMIFTGQVWNMAFSFYGSLKAVPEDLKAVTLLCRLGWWERFVRLDLSFAATGLIWNSMISMAGGWFFLTVSEAFVLGKQDFRVPGLGSYMSVAIERGNTRAQLFAVLAMIAMIIFLDWLVWRPIVAWSQKFSTDESERSEPTGLQTWLRFRRSAVFQILCKLAGKGLALCRQIITRLPPLTALPSWNRKSFLLLFRILGVAAVLAAIFAVAEYIHFIKELSAADWRNLLGSAWATFLRVAAAVGIASLWTVPVGVFIGRNPRWARQLQPIIQIVASFPAPMIFPLVISLILWLGGTLGIGSTILLMLSSQWYILFNAIAGD